MIITAKKSTTFTIKRKKRCDAGNTLLNSNKKCESVITAKHVFKKIKQQQTTGGERLTRDELFSAWTSLSNDRLCELNRTALEQKTRCQTLYLEIGQVLRRTRGAITWRQLTSQINGVGTPVIHWSSMRRYVMKLPQSSYTATRLLPKLNSGTKKKRLDWAKAFWLFWNEAKLLTNVMVLLVHMDKKWFYSTVKRKNNKYVPFLGMEKPTYHRVNKKSHLDKEMYICSTAFLPSDNNIASGGLSFCLSCERVGHYTPARKTTYRRVYNNDDGSYTYPQIEENILRRRNELYFQGLEIKGTSEGTVSKPKYSLLNFFLQKELLKLDELTEDLTNRYGT